MVNSDMYRLREEQERARREYEARRVLVRAPQAPDAADQVFRAIGQFGSDRGSIQARPTA